MESPQLQHSITVNIYVKKKTYEALQDIVYIQLPPGINFRLALKRSEITVLGYFWSCKDLTKI